MMAQTPYEAAKATLRGASRASSTDGSSTMDDPSYDALLRAAQDYGFRCTLVEDACATRDLPTRDGIIPAVDVQRTEMAIMNDNFATLARTRDLI